MEALPLQVAVICPLVATFNSTLYTPAAVVAGKLTRVVLPSFSKHVASVLLAVLTTTRWINAPAAPKAVVDVAATAT